MRKNITKTSVKFSRRTLFTAAVAALLLAPVSTLVVRAASCSSSSDCSHQINNLQDKNDSARSALDGLLDQASSYQDAINSLQHQINELAAVIHANEVKQAKIEAKIEKNQAELDHHREVLAAAVKAVYVDGQMSTIEMLATSKSLSAYVDKEEYRETVQTKIRETMAQIAELQKTLQLQKSSVQSLLENKRSQQSELAAARAKQKSMLAYNESQQANFNSQIKANNSKIAKLRAQQAALNAVGAHSVYVPASGGSGGKCDAGNGNGGYPMKWCNAAQDSVHTSFGWSANNRECTSYAFWYFTSILGHGDFKVSGNANQWLRTSSYPTHSAPARNSIGVKTAGTYGHVVIIHALPGDTYKGVTVPRGEVLVSEMNYDWNGHFRYSLRDINTFAGFIY